MGSTINAALDAAEGDLTGAAINAVGLGATGVANKGVDILLKGEEAAVSTSKKLLKRGNSVKSGAIGKTVSEGVDKENE